jgi:hypothetical protein
MLSMFQTASGEPHWPSIVQAVGSLFALAIVLLGIYFASRDRFKSAADLQKLKQQIPRTLVQEQREQFIATLASGPKGPVCVMSRTTGQSGPDADATNFSEELSALFREAGFETTSMTLGDQPAILPKGVTLWVNEAPPSHARVIQLAFKAVGLNVPIQPCQPKDSTCPAKHKLCQEGSVTIAIGARS